MWDWELKSPSNHKPFLAYLRFHHFPVHRKNVTDYQKQLAVKDYLVSRRRRAKAFKES